MPDGVRLESLATLRANVPARDSLEPLIDAVAPRWKSVFRAVAAELRADVLSHGGVIALQKQVVATTLPVVVRDDLERILEVVAELEIVARDAGFGLA